MNKDQIISECTFETSRSSGKGGQHVNKTETRVALLFDVQQSEGLEEEEKALIEKRLKRRIKEGVLRVVSQRFRSQLRNKKDASERMLELLEQALIKPKVRKRKGPSRAAIQARKKAKEKQSEKKDLRKKIRPEDF